MCDTSNSPTDSRTVRCSRIVPDGYCTGMSQPPKSISFAPSARCTSHSGVFLRSMDARTLHQHVLAHDGRVAHPAADLAVRAVHRREFAMFSPAQPRTLPHRDVRVADFGIRAE